MAVLLALTRDVPRSRIVWVGALAVFAVSGLHLTSHDGSEPWWSALIGHHASLPLGLAILQQHDRVAFADVFLRRALALGLLLMLPIVPFEPHDERQCFDIWASRVIGSTWT